MQRAVLGQRYSSANLALFFMTPMLVAISSSPPPIPVFDHNFFAQNLEASKR